MWLGLSLACRPKQSTTLLLCLSLLGICRPEYACILRLATLAKHPTLLLGGRTSKEPSSLSRLIVKSLTSRKASAEQAVVLLRLRGRRRGSEKPTTLSRIRCAK